MKICVPFISRQKSARYFCILVYQPNLMTVKRNAAVGFIFITVLVDVIGWGLIIPVMPRLIASMKHIPVNEASKPGGLLLMVYALMQFLFAPVLGNLSDRYGRRP